MVASRFGRLIGYTPPADTTAPILTSPLGAATGETTANLSVTTDEGNGTLYWYVSTSPSPPTLSNLKSGAGAVDYGSVSVISPGSVGALADALTAATGYYVHFAHTDAATNDSAIVSSGIFTTDDAADPTLTPPVLTMTTAQDVWPPIIAEDIDPATFTTSDLRIHVATSLSNLLAGTTVHDEVLPVGTGDHDWDFSALSAGVQYFYRERIEDGVDIGAWSNVVTSGDTAAPVLSSPSASTTGTTTADIAVLTDEYGGTMYYSVLPSADSAPTALEFLTGTTGGVATGSAYHAISGSNPFSVTGLDEAVAYKAHFYQQDLALRDSNIVSSSEFVTTDATGPTLSSPTAVATGPIMSYMTVSTDDNLGTLYWYVSTSATPPSVANLKAGTGAVAFGNQAVTTSGTQYMTEDGLTANTAYYVHFLHTDSGANNSSIVTSSSFTTVNLPQTGSLSLYLEPVLGTMYQEPALTNKTLADLDRVGYIPDFSGDGNHLINTIGASNRPQYRTGTPDYINFDGINHYLWKDSPSFNLWDSGGFTVAFALRGNPAVSRCFLANTTSANAIARIDVFRSDDGTASTAGAFYRSDASSTIVSSTADIKTGAWDNNDRVVIMVDDGSGVTVYVDGVAGTRLAYTRSTHAMTLNRLSLGAFYGSTLASAAALRFHALAVWPGLTAPTAPEIAQITTALGAIQGRSI